MPRKRRKKRVKRFDSRIKSKPKLIRALVYRYNIAEIDGRITLTIANNTGATFMFIYRGINSCTDTRRQINIDFNTAKSELKRMLGNDLGIIAHEEAIFRMAVKSW